MKVSKRVFWIIVSIILFFASKAIELHFQKVVAKEAFARGYFGGHVSFHEKIVLGANAISFIAFIMIIVSVLIYLFKSFRTLK